MTDTATAESKPVVIATEGGHWYKPDGTPMHEVPNASKPGTMRNTTLRDAKKLGLLPSVTSITKILHSEQLVKWRINEAAHALMTSPRREGENEDAFIERVLWTDREQDETAAAARDLGTRIHTALEHKVAGREYDIELEPYIGPAFTLLHSLGRPVGSERVVVGDGYAGKLDEIVESDGGGLIVVDYKSCKNLPREPYTEHLLQRAAYAGALATKDGLEIAGTANLYISTTLPGQCVIKVNTHSEWTDDYALGFLPLVTHWYWSSGMKRG